MTSLEVRDEAAPAARTRSKGERLDVRVTEDVKELIQKAADFQGQSVTDFVLDALIPKARRVILEHSVILMSREGQEQIANLLLNPPAPNAKLQALFDKYKDVDKDE